MEYVILNLEAKSEDIGFDAGLIFESIEIRMENGYGTRSWRLEAFEKSVGARIGAGDCHLAYVCWRILVADVADLELSISEVMWPLV